MIELTETNDGIILPVRASPGSRRNEIRGEQNGNLKVSVTAVAEKGKANQAIVALLAKQLGLRKSQLTLVSGETNRVKRFCITGTNRDSLRQMLAKFLSPDPPD